MAVRKSTATETSASEKAEAKSKVTEPAVEEKKTFKPKAFDPNQFVTVRNGYQGRLVYVSRKTGERFEWDEFGAEEDMEISELKSARNAHKRFFIDNWFMFDDPEVIEYLGVQKYYKHALTIDEFGDLFDKSAKEIREIVSELSDGQKKAVAYLAKKLIADGTIDSRQKIAALEDSIGTQLIED